MIRTQIGARVVDITRTLRDSPIEIPKEIKDAFKGRTPNLDFIYHGTSTVWVQEAIRRYHRFQNEHYSGNGFKHNLSIASEIEEAIVYAVKHGFETGGSLLIIPFQRPISERFDLAGLANLDAPMPYLLPQEFVEFRLRKIPGRLREILEVPGLLERREDLEDVLFRFLDSEIERINTIVKRIKPDHVFNGSFDIITETLQHSGTIYPGSQITIY